MKNLTTIMISTSFLFLSMLCHAQKVPLIMETDWLDTSVGSQGDMIGAKVIDVDKVLEKNLTILELSIPLDNPNDIDKIQVIDKKTAKPIPQYSAPAWIEDYEKDTHGLRLYLKQKPEFEFRLRFIDNEDIRNNNRY